MYHKTSKARRNQENRKTSQDNDKELGNVGCVAIPGRLSIMGAHPGFEDAHALMSSDI